MTRRSALVTSALLSTSLLLAGCGEEQGPSPAPQEAGESAAPEDLLAEHGLQGMDAKQIIEKLDRADEKPAGLEASVHYDELVLTDAEEPDRQVNLPIKRSFYLSVAPYLDKTHDCRHRSLTSGPEGELAEKELRVLLIGLDGEIIATDTVTTGADGFVGFWLQRDIDATLQMSYDGRTGYADISTHRRAPTCLTTLRLT